MAHLNINNKVYDALNYNEGVVIEITEDNKVVYLNNDDKFITIPLEYAYMVNEELSQEYGILICIEHNKDIDYPYYIPIADENAYAIELEHFSMEYR